MVKKALILLLFSMVTNLFAAEYENHFSSDHECFGHNHGNQVIVPELGFEDHSFGQSISFSNGVQLRATVSCPMCDGDVVDGVCVDCGYVLGTGVGTPIGEGFWSLLAIACIYSYYQQRRRRVERIKWCPK